MILITSLSSFTTKRDEDEEDGEVERDSGIGTWIQRLKMRWQRLKSIKELHVRIRSLSHSTRLQNRVLFKAYKSTQMLMGPGLLPAMAAVVLVLFLPRQSAATTTPSVAVHSDGLAASGIFKDMNATLEELLAFLWVLRDLWDVVPWLLESFKGSLGQ